MSSRNRYLSPSERQIALTLRLALSDIEERATQGETRSSLLIESGLQVLARQPQIRLDYLKIVDPDTLEEIGDVRNRNGNGNGALVAVAAWVGSTRLIDNIVLEPK
jgi:pantoate--beta-alanine ligase